MDQQHILLCAAVFVPIIGSFLLPFLGRISLGTRNAAAFLLIAIAFICTALLAPSVFSGQTSGHTVTFDIGTAAFPLTLKADGLAVFVGLVSSFVSALIVLYSWGYVSHYRHQNEYYLEVVLFLGAMMGLVYSANLLLLYIFWEITAFASWRLIGFFREKDYIVRADKAFLVTGFGAFSMLLGFIILYTQSGSFEMSAVTKYFADPAVPAPNFAIALILLGILSKSATLPFHTWLPDAGVAPSPVTALLHAAVLVKIGVYAYARLFIVMLPLAGAWLDVVLVTAAASALVSAGAALIDTNMKRIIAYSTVSQIAFIFLGLASGSAIGITGAILYILMHGLAKAGLFLSAGIIEQNTHTKDITKMGGLIRTMPITAVAFLLCAFSVMGIPPFGGFFSKFLVIQGAVDAGRPWIAGVFVFGAVLTLLYLWRIFTTIFFGDAQAPATEGSRLMVVVVALLAVLGLVGGILVAYPSDWANAAVRQIPGLGN